MKKLCKNKSYLIYSNKYIYIKIKAWPWLKKAARSKNQISHKVKSYLWTKINHSLLIKNVDINLKEKYVKFKGRDL